MTKWRTTYKAVISYGKYSVLVWKQLDLWMFDFYTTHSVLTLGVMTVSDLPGKTKW